MNIFHKRPLGLILCVILGGFSLFVLLSDIWRAAALSASVIICFLAFFFKRWKNKIFRIASVALLCSCILSFVYFEIIFYPNEYYGKEVTIEGHVTDIDVKSEYYRMLDMKVSSIDGEACNYKIKVNLYGYHEDVDIGNIISLTAALAELESDGSFDFKQYYTARGFSATATASYYDFIESGELSLEYKLSGMREALCERAVRLSNDSAGAMLGALLLGERDMLSGQIRLDFTRIGISHILSLSGMHLTILMAAINAILLSLRVGKRWRVGIGVVFALFFMALTGFPLSVCRAGFMLIISSVLYLLSGSKDGLTSLAIAAALIVLISPYASQDIGLWLSVLSTAGILIISEHINEKCSEEKGLKKLFHAVTLSLKFSLFAISATAAVTALNFDGTSGISALSTLLFSFLTEVYVYIGILVLIFGGIISIGGLLIGLEAFIASFAALLSDLTFVYASSEFLIIKILFIILFSAFLLFAVLKIENKKRYIGFLTALFIASCILPVGFTLENKADDEFIVNSASSDLMIIKTDGTSLLFDASSHDVSEAFDSLDVLFDEKIVDLDCYMVANYTDYLPDGISVLLSNVLIREIKLPIPRSSDEEEIAINCIRQIGEFRCSLSFYADKSATAIGDYEILVPFRDSDSKAVAVTFKRGDEIYSYMSSGVLEFMPYSEELLYVSDVLIFGKYGESYTNIKVIDEFGKKLKKVVVYDKKINFDVSDTVWEAPKLYFTKERNVIYD